VNAPNFYRHLIKSQRRGVLWTFVIFLGLHMVLYFLSDFEKNSTQGLALDVQTQQQLDSIWVSKKHHKPDTIYPFNPNYISDYKAYQLEIPMQVVERIRTHVNRGNYINSVPSFKRVTQLSDSAVNRIKPYLKIPKRIKRPKHKRTATVKIELNAATAEQLTKVFGIGEFFASRIVALRKSLNGFLIPDQLADVWGLSEETQERLWTHFSLDSVPKIKKKNINQLTIAELSQMYYVTPALASSIVAVRTQKGELSSWDDLAHVQQLDSLKKARLSLYLSFK
jgi:competence protein ComEA